MGNSFAVDSKIKRRDAVERLMDDIDLSEASNICRDVASKCQMWGGMDQEAYNALLEVAELIDLCKSVGHDAAGDSAISVAIYIIQESS